METTKGSKGCKGGCILLSGINEKEMPMRIKLKVSKSMSSSSSPLGSIEDRLVRIPKELREALGLKIGLFLCLRSKEGKSEARPIPLQITMAFGKDAVEDDSCAYVSRDTIEKIDTEKVRLIKPADNVLIGCDPEFFLIDKTSGTNVSAGHFFAHYGELGSDCGLAELRPRPGFSEDEVVTNLRDLLVRAHKHIKDRRLFKNREIEMTAASSINRVSAGFHVHFGLPSRLLSEKRDSRNFLTKVVNILDYYVGIPSIIPEGSEDYHRRSVERSQYGKAGDFRADHMTLEYRVPGGHLLGHPLLSKGILGLNIVVMKDILSRLKAYSDNYKDMDILRSYEDLYNLYPNLPSQTEVYESIRSEDIGRAVSHIDKIMEDLSKMIGFKERFQVITDYFKYAIVHIGHGEKFSQSLELNWRLEDEGQSKQVEVL